MKNEIIFYYHSINDLKKRNNFLYLEKFVQ